MKRPFQMIVLSLWVLGCAIPPFITPAPQVNDIDCSSIVVTDDDVDFTLKYGEKLLSQADWKRSYTVNTDQVFASYLSENLNAVVFVDTLILCNAKTELKNYASKENLAIMLQNYDKNTPTASCEQDGTLFFQFTAVNDNTKKYNINLWLTPLQDPNRAMEVMLVFPSEDQNSMNEYSRAFFPDLTSCK